MLLPLFANKIRDLKSEESELSARRVNLSDDELDEMLDLQEMVSTYENMLDELHSEYRKALIDGVNLPDFEVLVANAKPINT